MTESKQDNILFILTLKDNGEGTIYADIRSYDESARNLAVELIGKEEHMRHFVANLGEYKICIWDEVLPTKMMVKFHAQGVFNGISIKEQSGDTLSILNYAFTLPSATITKCLHRHEEIHGEIHGEMRKQIDAMADIVEKSHSSHH